MRNHYTPKQYLRNFLNAEGGLWQHDCKLGTSRTVNVDGVGNEVGLYSEKVERELNTLVEIPTHHIFKKILAKQAISAEDRTALAKYIVILLKRVPAARDRAMETLPHLASAYLEGVQNELTKFAQSDPTYLQRTEEVRKEVEHHIERVRSDLPTHLWYEGFNLTDEGPVEQALLSMKWVFLHSKSLQYLTSDNPVFYFVHEGIGGPLSEVTFPISSSIALWATRRIVVDGSHLQASPSAVRQINSRTAHNCKRFILSRDNETWILPFISKGEWELQRMGIGLPM